MSVVELTNVVPELAGVPLPQFLQACSRLMADGSSAGQDEDLVRACRVFVDGGLAALRQDRDSVDWLQYDLAFAPAGRRGCYPHLSTAVRELLAAEQIDDFFFMHKPPGLRIRFHPTAGARAKVDEVVRGHLLGWQRDELVRDWRAACYEPEVQLFGGPVSMRTVHRLFTADSLVWLAYHGAATAHATAERGTPPGPSWALSMLMLRSVFDALEIVGWEDLDVWDRVRWQTGRRLGPEVAEQLDLQPLITGLRSGWSAPTELLEMLSPDLHVAVAQYRETVAVEGRRWRQEYFHSGAATLGPRAAMAYLIIFHWNRAGLASTRQNLLTEVMATHTALVETGGAGR
jgi:thiopeptide-type bacteriocin biosynthesis protein